MNGRQIRLAREARGWTQEELAARVGVGHRTIGNWERNETIPKNRLGRLLELFGDADADDPIRSAPDVVLLSELLRRASLRDEHTA